LTTRLSSQVEDSHPTKCMEAEAVKWLSSVCESFELRTSSSLSFSETNLQEQEVEGRDLRCSVKLCP